MPLDLTKDETEKLHEILAAGKEHPDFVHGSDVMTVVEIILRWAGDTGSEPKETKSKSRGRPPKSKSTTTTATTNESKPETSATSDIFST
jgi:hypothetical protein